LFINNIINNSIWTVIEIVFEKVKLKKYSYTPQKKEDHTDYDKHLYSESKAKYVFDDARIMFKLLPSGHLVTFQFVVWHTDVLGAYIATLQSTAHRFWFFRLVARCWNALNASGLEHVSQFYVGNTIDNISQ